MFYTQPNSNAPTSLTSLSISRNKTKAGYFVQKNKQNGSPSYVTMREWFGARGNVQMHLTDKIYSSDIVF
jgi:hypothetical protein